MDWRLDLSLWDQRLIESFPRVLYGAHMDDRELKILLQTHIENQFAILAQLRAIRREHKTSTRDQARLDAYAAQIDKSATDLGKAADDVTP